MAQKRGLGKGLDALFIDNAVKAEASAPEPIKLSEIEPNREQPRKEFDDEALQQLAGSIREHGLIQPLVVRPKKEGGYQIIAGERRWRASRMAGLTEVPTIVMEIDDRKAMELALIENLQREDLNPLEEALGYQQLMDSYELALPEVANVIGKSRSAISNAMRLLNLPEEVLGYLREGKLSAGQARTLLAFEDPGRIREMAERAIRQGLSVRDLERIARLTAKPTPKKKAPAVRDSYYAEMELAVRDELHRRIKVKERENKGTIEIEFYSKQDFAELISRLAAAERTSDYWE